MKLRWGTPGSASFVLSGVVRGEQANAHPTRELSCLLLRVYGEVSPGNDLAARDQSRSKKHGLLLPHLSN